MHENMHNKNIISTAIKVLSIEAAAVKKQIKHLDCNFTNAVKLIGTTAGGGGKIIITGVGKSGLIARKISATFSSLGIPSVFVNITELVHGDLGMITSNDMVFILSYSGESDEIKSVAPIIKSIGPKIVVMTGRKKSFLGRLSDCVIDVSVEKEACPFNLIPTASTTAMLALGDALALSIAALKGFKKSDFAMYHPGGNLGKRMRLKVSVLMHKGKNNPTISEKATVMEALFVMTKTKLGAVSIVNNKKKLVGYFTDGDLRRKLQKNTNLLKEKIKDVMTKNPKTISPDALVEEAAKIMKQYNCDNLPVVTKDGKPIGMIDERDIILTGII